jgi:hypothetical protein
MNPNIFLLRRNHLLVNSFLNYHSSQLLFQLR